MADARRLMALGFAGPLAVELAAQIEAREGNMRRLMALGVVPELAKELVSQIGASTNARRLVELSMVPQQAKEVVAQIEASPSPLRAALEAGRVDFVGIGDSNQILSGFGWDHGFQYALLTRGHQAFATGLVSQNEGGGSGAGQGYGYSRAGSLIGSTTGAPSELQRYYSVGSGGLSPASPTYLADGATTTTTVASGLAVHGDVNLLDNTAALAFDIHFGTFPSGSGQFRASARIETSPYSGVASNSIRSTNTGGYGMARETLTLSASPARAGLSIAGRPILMNTTGITGPYFNTYYRWRNPARVTGWAYGTLEFRGGQSMRTFAVDFQQASNETLTHYFSTLRDDQGVTQKTIVLCVNGGLNDRNETLPSVGPAAVSDGDSPEAFVDNFTAIRNRIEAIWALNGWSAEELHWLVFPSHPVSDPDDPELVAYRTALEAYVSTMPQAYFVNLAEITSAPEMLAGGWYASGGSDRNHLTQAGYEQLGLRVIEAVGL